VKETNRERVLRLSRNLGLVVFVLVMLNAGWGFLESVIFGNALNGYESNGHYFVPRGSGYVEVGQATWVWLRIHGWSTWTIPLGYVGLFWYVIRDWTRRIAGLSTPSETKARVECVRGSSAPLATTRASGRLGRTSLPFIRVTAYSGGIVIKPILMPEHAVLASEITDIKPRQTPAFRDFEIAHEGVDVRSPLVISTKEEDPIVAAIRSITPARRAGD
jgi:hypothetical protein